MRQQCPLCGKFSLPSFTAIDGTTYYECVDCGYKWQSKEPEADPYFRGIRND